MSIKFNFGLIACVSFLILFLNLDFLNFTGLKQEKHIITQLDHLISQSLIGKNSPVRFLKKYECSISRLKHEKKTLRKNFQFLKDAIVRIFLKFLLKKYS